MYEPLHSVAPTRENELQAGATGMSLQLQYTVYIGLFLDSYSIESTSGIGPAVFVLIITLRFYVAEPFRKLTVTAAVLV